MLDPFRVIVEESMRLEREIFREDKKNKEVTWEIRMKKKLGLDSSGNYAQLTLCLVYI